MTEQNQDPYGGDPKPTTNKPPASGTTKPPDMTPRKAFKLIAGKEHSQDGTMVRAGDTVYLTQSQAAAFRDKFEAVDDAEFKAIEGGYQPYVPGSVSGEPTEPAPSDQEGQIPGEQGDPVQTPPVVVGTEAPASGTGTVALPDPTAIDPARQGQQSREVRAIIDAGGAPPAKGMKDVPSLDEQRSEVRGAEKKDDASKKGKSK